MDDLDMLYDYYKDVNLAAGAYATLSSRIKDDKLEKFYKRTAAEVMIESSLASEIIIKYGGTIF